MFLKASRNNVEFRPHFKTHQSLEVGRWFKDFGVNKVTVSSFQMADYFSEEWDDITVAFPVNILEIETINSLAEKIKLNLLVESVDAAEFLQNNLKNKVRVFVKIDVGYNRTGISPTNTVKVDEIIGVLTRSDFLKFEGFLAHAGHSYNCRSKREVLKLHEESLATIVPLKDRYKVDYPNLIVSVGDTPSCSIAEDFSEVDEIRPGNFVFYDLVQHQIGSCEIDEIAVAVACPIVAIHKERREIVVYGGGVHLSKERIEDDELGTIYGKAVEQKGDKWGDVIPNMFVKSLSQEHGIISVPESRIAGYNIGGCLMILPVHSCMTANLIDLRIS